MCNVYFGGGSVRGGDGMELVGAIKLIGGDISRVSLVGQWLLLL